MKANKAMKIIYAMFILVTVQTASLAQRPMRMSPEERTSQLTKDLGLSDQQAAAVKKIFEAQQQEMQKLFESAGEDRSAMRETMMKKGKETDDKIAALLTKEQKVKFIELQEQRRTRLEQRRKQHD